METTTTEQQNQAVPANAECEKVISILELIIDNEAREDEKTFFYNHLDECAACFEEHKHQKMLKSFLKQSVKMKDVPADLFSTIKNIVKETV